MAFIYVGEIMNVAQADLSGSVYTIESTPSPQKNITVCRTALCMYVYNCANLTISCTREDVVG